MPDGNTGTALTRAQEFNQQLDLQAENFKALLPSHISPEKFKRVVVVAVSQNPDLFNADRRSFFNAAQKCASDGLLPDGREAALVVFNTRMKVKLPDGTQQENWVPLVQFMPMIAGVRKRMRNSGEVTSAEAYVVYRNDKFFQKFGDDPAIVHEPPAFGADRGDPVGAYAIIRLKNGETLREVMDYAEIERVRLFSKGKDGPAWKNWWGEMARKTVLRRCSKAAPNSADIDALLARDDEAPDPPSLIELTAMEPEPQRQITEREHERGLIVIDADGEEHEYAEPDTVERALGVIFGDAKRRGAEALQAAAGNNRATIAQLPSDAFTRLDALYHELDADTFGLPPLPSENSPPAQPVHERNTGGLGGPAPAGEPDQSPSRTASPGSAAGHPGVDATLPAESRLPVEDVSRRGDLLDAPEPENLTVPLPPRPTEGQLDHFARQMFSMIGEKPKTAQRIALIRQKNAHGIGLLKAGAPELYDDLQAALAAKPAG